MRQPLQLLLQLQPRRRLLPPPLLVPRRLNVRGHVTGCCCCCSCYRGGLTASSVCVCVTTVLASADTASEMPPRSISEEALGIVELTDENFEQVVMESEEAWIVKVWRM